MNPVSVAAYAALALSLFTFYLQRKQAMTISDSLAKVSADVATLSSGLKALQAQIASSPSTLTPADQASLDALVTAADAAAALLAPAAAKTTP